VAFQLTNILRDVREDGERGRVYFPTEDLDRFGVSRQDLLLGRDSAGFRQLLRFEAARAKKYYQDSAPLVDLVHRGNRSSLWALIEIYQRLLEKIERSDFDVLSGRISLPAIEKCYVVARAAFRSRS
jgi:phytoene synthase